MNRALDWAALRRLALGDMGLKPQEFWQLTPLEFRLMQGAGVAAVPLGRQAFEALAASYPDMKGKSDGRS